jgi:CSLREA domain-containing protein
MSSRRRCLPIALAAMIATASLSRSATFTVNTTDDDVDVAPGDGICATASGTCTLRAAIQETNSLPGSDVIVLPAGHYLLTIPGKEDAGAAGDLDVWDNLRILGAGAASTVIDANRLDRVLAVDAPQVPEVGPGPVPSPSGVGVPKVYLSGVSLVNGYTMIDADTGFAGGAIRNAGRLTLENCIVSGNEAVIGGALNSEGVSVTILSTTISNNVGHFCCGAIRNYYGVKLLMRNSVVEDNTVTTGNGGGVADFYPSSFTAYDSTFSGNVAGNGGGIFVTGRTTLKRCTITGNSASGSGGGLYRADDEIYHEAGRLRITDTTISGNTADSDASGQGDGGGIYNSVEGLSMARGTLSGNVDGTGEAPDCAGQLVSKATVIGSVAGCAVTAH